MDLKSIVGIVFDLFVLVGGVIIITNIFSKKEDSSQSNFLKYLLIIAWILLEYYLEWHDRFF